MCRLYLATQAKSCGFVQSIYQDKQRGATLIQEIQELSWTKRCVVLYTDQ